MKFLKRLILRHQIKKSTLRFRKLIQAQFKSSPTEDGRWVSMGDEVARELRYREHLEAELERV